jgi:hypothetical protein
MFLGGLLSTPHPSYLSHSPFSPILHSSLFPFRHLSLFLPPLVLRVLHHLVSLLDLLLVVMLHHLHLRAIVSYIISRKMSIGMSIRITVNMLITMPQSSSF